LSAQEAQASAEAQAEKAARAKRGKGARAKGATFEREVAERLRRVWPGAKRGLGQARQGREVPDIDGTPYWIELKHRKARPQIQAAWQQALDDSAGDAVPRPGPVRPGETFPPRRPVAITRQNNGPILVTMELADWLAMVELASL
jgi:hypothetical protein